MKLARSQLVARIRYTIKAILNKSKQQFHAIKTAALDKAGYRKNANSLVIYGPNNIFQIMVYSHTHNITNAQKNHSPSESFSEGKYIKSNISKYNRT